MLRQTIDATSKTTSGEYRITKIYGPDYQEKKTRTEAPDGKSFF